MEQYIKKSSIVAEINRIKKEECPTDSYEGRCKLLWFERFLSFIDTLEVKDPYEQCVQYSSIEDGIKAHAETYSFNIESELFNQLTKEQQALWRKEIEQACISGGEVGVELARDTRYKENLEVEEVDLEKELKNLIGNVGQCDRKLARHFFELGMRFSAIGSDYIDGVRGYYETTTK